MSSLEDNFNENVQLKAIKSNSQILTYDQSTYMYMSKLFNSINFNTYSYKLTKHTSYAVKILNLTVYRTIYNYTSTQVFQCNELV
jgi:hypothetical protein